MKKVIFEILIMISICSCGFEPMYSYNSKENIQTITENVFINPIEGTNGIEMRNSLKTLLNPYGDPSEKKYELTVNLSTSSVYKGIEKTGDATWLDIQVVAKYELINAETKKILFKGTDTSAESYPIVQDLIAATSSKESATRNVIHVLSEKIGKKIQLVMKNEVETK